MNVGTVMRPDPVTLDITDRLDIADDLMRLGRIRHLPVLDGARLVGIVSQRDLFRAAVSSLLELGYAAERHWLRMVPVHRVMTSPVFSIAPSEPLQAAVDLMLEKKVGCLPVVENGALVGILSEADCLARLRTLLDAGDTRQALPELAPAG